ncbi:ZIP zinc transporter [Xylariomycetidae sp. FL2044]|nr:ZIP zinc transporter [Xylariomycetidae sp. FL2044]
MRVTEVDNDTRGWIMCIVSGIACVLGASIICVDELVRRFPGKRNFRIQDSNTFLACSLSLSFGVMLFMSLYSMLPEAKENLEKGGLNKQAAEAIMMGCFIGGFVGIQILSRFFHQLLPSHVVDCDHSHQEHTLDDHSHTNGQGRRQSSHARSVNHRSHSLSTHANTSKSPLENGNAHESTPLLPADGASPKRHGGALNRADTVPAPLHPTFPRLPRSRATTSDRRPSMLGMPNRVLSFVKDTKSNCDEAGPCYGYSDPCGQECFKHLTSRSSILSRVPTMSRAASEYHDTSIERVEEELDDHDRHDSIVSPKHQRSRAQSREAHHHPDNTRESEDNSEDLEAQHHHHVAENAFLSIGLQTSIAITLHKLPEGFITYATNHANPNLGFNVFLALFVHNISEGFALALPLYMALNSRLRAMLWASVLGGLSQPLGAGIAVLWFQLAKKTHMNPDEVAYGCLFAITAGIMASVALCLFVESLSLNHNQNLSIMCAFLGMSLLGLSSAFTSDVH